VELEFCVPLVIFTVSAKNEISKITVISLPAVASASMLYVKVIAIFKPLPKRIDLYFLPKVFSLVFNFN
jgi:hypothetical protein